jgi:hypothetical protein
MWLNLFVDNWQSGYIKKFKVKNPSFNVDNQIFQNILKDSFFPSPNFVLQNTIFLWKMNIFKNNIIDVQAAKVLWYCSYPIAMQRWNHKERKYFSFTNVRLSWDV